LKRSGVETGRRAGSELSDILFQHLRNKQAAAVEHMSQAEPAPSASGKP